MSDILKAVLGDDTPPESKKSKHKKEWNEIKAEKRRIVEKARVTQKPERQVVEDNSLVKLMIALMGHFQVNDLTMPKELIDAIPNDLEIIVSDNFIQDSITVRVNRKDFWLDQQ